MATGDNVLSKLYIRRIRYSVDPIGLLLYSYYKHLAMEAKNNKQTPRTQEHNAFLEVFHK